VTFWETLLLSFAAGLAGGLVGALALGLLCWVDLRWELWRLKR
jgi:hypothetical protein